MKNSRIFFWCLLVAATAGFVHAQIPGPTLAAPGGTAGSLPLGLSQSTPKKVECIYGNYVSLSAAVGFPMSAKHLALHYQWLFNGTNLPTGATNVHAFYATDESSGIYSLLVSNRDGSARVNWQVTVTNEIDVARDLLLIYNTNSAASGLVLDYYLANRPLVRGANVLGIGWPGIFIANKPGYGKFIGLTGVPDYETICPAAFTNLVLNPVRDWLAVHPALRPQYVVGMPDLPARISASATNVESFPFYPPANSFASVSVQLAQGNAGWRPFITDINMYETNDCVAYINKLRDMGARRPGKLLISASAGGYNNTNWYFDDSNNLYPHLTPGLTASNGVAAAGAAPGAVTYMHVIPDSGWFGGHIFSGMNAAGYLCWGVHSTLRGNYPGTVRWAGDSSWYLMETIESFNGMRYELGQGNFREWFAATAFGGEHYANTPVGAVSSPDEPYSIGASNAKGYFGLWAAGKNFGICAWESRQTQAFQATGDPFVEK